MNETNKFKLWDWDKSDWVSPEDIGDALLFNWHVSGEDEGVAWGEVAHNRNIDMVFADSLGNFKKPTDE